MDQYERIVSYIYQYEGEEKGVNAGYAKLEKRGNQCRFSVQIRAIALKEVPKVYCYRQFEEGIQTIYAGTMTLRGNNMLWKGVTDADRLFQSDWNIDEMDGIFIDGADKIYFATSWKQDRFYLGNWNGSSMHVENKEEKTAEASNVKMVEASMEKETVQETEKEPESVRSETEQEIKTAEFPSGEIALESEESVESDIQMQSVCGVCPFKRKVYDYGKKILMTFPSMKPFQEGVANACVRMELQDIGCLPITSWSLSGNRFLLHGYYCYRHLLFAQLPDGKYVLGVPGVFSEKEKQNALRFGFSDFQSIGEMGRQQGAFGYWFLELPKGSA